MDIDVKQLAGDMLKAALDAVKPILGAKAGDVQKYLASESNKMAETLKSIAEGKAAGHITDQQAKILLDMQKNASLAVLAAVQGIGQQAATNALGAALNAVKDVINKVIGFPLL